jgi:hypothetical protein
MTDPKIDCRSDILPPLPVAGAVSRSLMAAEQGNRDRPI